ncbi:hypothetical protein [Paenibacillus sp. FSL H8-0332]|uniref:hypothetical protein n=1 Tax=Paenibacillus sp. FSL H8-0332 TaxID=2954742 RepID=UPI0030CB3E30
MIAASGSTQTAQLPAIQIYLNNSPITTSARGATLMNGTVMLSLDWNAKKREAFISYPHFVGDGMSDKDAVFLNVVKGTQAR